MRFQLRAPVDTTNVYAEVDLEMKAKALAACDTGGNRLTTIGLSPTSLDAVFTDPPYFGNVQYGELMDFCYVWLQRLAGKESEGFDRVSTRALEELTANVTRGRDLEHFTDGLSAVYKLTAIQNSIFQRFNLEWKTRTLSVFTQAA
jgi:hypothetical protein